MLRSADITQIEGRVLVTGQDETSGSNYVLLQSIRGEVVQIPQVREFLELRQHGGLKSGSYLRLTVRRDQGEKLRFDAVDWATPWRSCRTRRFYPKMLLGWYQSAGGLGWLAGKPPRCGVADNNGASPQLRTRQMISPQNPRKHVFSA
jgi:hypothetical protein